jgi:uracil phosphoribosyltransferase
MEHAKSILMTILRNKQTTIDQFRATAHQLALIMAQEATNFIPTSTHTITTPLNAPFTGACWTQPITLIPILRSGLALLPAFLQYFPHANIGVVGLKRDEATAIAHWYYKNIPSIPAKSTVIILDPMIATGGSALATLDMLANLKITQAQIIFVGIISAQDGITAIKNSYPDIKIITADCDQQLNQAKYIVPGLGDFGDRYFGTE